MAINRDLLQFQTVEDGAALREAYPAQVTPGYHMSKRHWISLGPPPADPHDDDAPARLEPGDTAPDFTLPTDDGGEVSLSALRGRKVDARFFKVVQKDVRHCAPLVRECVGDLRVR